MIEITTWRQIKKLNPSDLTQKFGLLAAVNTIFTLPSCEYPHSPESKHGAFPGVLQPIGLQSDTIERLNNNREDSTCRRATRE